MNSAELTEKLKEILLTHKIILGDRLALRVVRKLTPEIEKLLPRWIPLSEKLPDDCVNVLAIWHDGTLRLAWLESGEWTYYGKEGMMLAGIPPTHWMPLPEGPRE